MEDEGFFNNHLFSSMEGGFNMQMHRPQS